MKKNLGVFVMHQNGCSHFLSFQHAYCRRDITMSVSLNSETLVGVHVASIYACKCTWACICVFMCMHADACVVCVHECA